LRVKTLGERSYFGEIALLRDPPTRRMATVRSLTAVELLSLHRDDFRELLRTRPRLAEAVNRLAGLRARQSEALADA
jgi:CRP-like cAMP-binding protein